MRSMELTRLPELVTKGGLYLAWVWKSVSGSLRGILLDDSG